MKTWKAALFALVAAFMFIAVKQPGNLKGSDALKPMISRNTFTPTMWQSTAEADQAAPQREPSSPSAPGPGTPNASADDDPLLPETPSEAPEGLSAAAPDMKGAPAAESQTPLLPSLPHSLPLPKPPLSVAWPVFNPEGKEKRPPPPASLPEPFWQHLTNVTGEGKTSLYPLSEIVANQWPQDCSKRKTLEVHLHGYEGLFASVSAVTACLALALKMNRTFIIRGGGSIYATETQTIKMTKGITMNYVPLGVKNVYIHFHQITKLLRKVWENPPLEGPHVAHNANILAYMFRPAPPIVEYAAQMKRYLGLDKVRYAAIHIRKTDKKHFEYTFETKEYIAFLHNAMAGTGIETVFIMTDTVTTLHEVQALNTSLRFVWQPELRPEAGITPTLQKSEGSSVQHSAEWLADILIASESSFFVGTCNSHVGRVMIALVAARQMRPPFTEYPPNVKMVDESKCGRHAKDWIAFTAMPRFTQQAKSKGNATWLKEAAAGGTRHKFAKRIAFAEQSEEEKRKVTEELRRMNVSWHRGRYTPKNVG